MKNLTYEIFALGDNAVTLSFGNEIDNDAYRKLIVVRERLSEKYPAMFTDLVIAYSSLTIFYDLALAAETSNSKPYELVQSLVKSALEEAFSDTESLATPLKRIPVCYERKFGFDLDHIAGGLGLSPEEIVEAHLSQKYQVYMIGFLPGFPYMGTLPPEIQIPRKEKPNPAIPKGSVAIAGKQTGIYPHDSPGGWHVIGRTPLVLFDSFSAQPSWLEAGDLVEFYPVSESEFNLFR